ncbi:MAG: hypothetical protein D6731_04520, partial [Planctomycetota bacterium]
MNWLGNQIGNVCRKWVANNSWQFEKLLTDSQRVSFEFHGPNNGQYCKDLRKLLRTIEERLDAGDAFSPPPALLLLSTG